MRLYVIVLGTASMLLCALAVGAHEGKDLPAGPIRERHYLMEDIGKNSKVIGAALKAGDSGPVAGAAENIQADAAKITGLFPPGSSHPKSRAKPEIWTNWAKFEANAKALQSNAGALANAAKSGGDVKAAADTMFDGCKSCHDDFRVPEKKKRK